MIRVAAVVALLLLYSQFPFFPAMVYPSAALQFAAAILQNAFLARILVTKNESVSLANSHLVVLLMLSAYSSVKLLGFAMSSTHILALTVGTLAQITLSLFFDGLIIDRDNIMHFLCNVCRTIKDFLVIEYEANVFFQSFLPVSFQVCWRLATLAAHGIVFVLRVIIQHIFNIRRIFNIQRIFTKKEQEKVNVEPVPVESPNSTHSSSNGKESAPKHVLGIAEEAALRRSQTGSPAPKQLDCFWKYMDKYNSEQYHEKMRRMQRDQTANSEQSAVNSAPSSPRPLPETVKAREVDDELTSLVESNTAQKTDTVEEVKSETPTPLIPVAIEQEHLKHHVQSSAQGTLSAASSSSSKEDSSSVNPTSSSVVVSSLAAHSCPPKKVSFATAGSLSQSEGPSSAAPFASSARNTVPATPPPSSSSGAKQRKEEPQAAGEPASISFLAPASVAQPCEEKPAAVEQLTPATPSLSSTQATATGSLASASVSVAEGREEKPEATEQPTPATPLSAVPPSSSPIADSDASFVTASSTPPSSPVQSEQTPGLPVTPTDKAAAPDRLSSPSSKSPHLQNHRSARINRRYARSDKKSTSNLSRYVVVESPTEVHLVRIPSPSPSAINQIQELINVHKVSDLGLADTKTKKKAHSYRVVKASKQFINSLSRRLAKRYRAGLHNQVNKKKVDEEKLYAARLENITLSLQKLPLDPGAMIVDRPERPSIFHFSPPSVDRVSQDADSPMVDVDDEDASRLSGVDCYADQDTIMEDADIAPGPGFVDQSFIPSSPEVVMQDVTGDEQKVEMTQRLPVKIQLNRYQQEPEESQPFLRASREVVRSREQDVAANTQPQRSLFAPLPDSAFPSAPHFNSRSMFVGRNQAQAEAQVTSTRPASASDFSSASLTGAYEMMQGRNNHQAQQPVTSYPGSSYVSETYGPRYAAPGSQSTSASSLQAQMNRTVLQVDPPTQPAAMASPFKRTTPFQHGSTSVLQSSTQATVAQPRNIVVGPSQAPQSSVTAPTCRMVPPPAQVAGASPRNAAARPSQLPQSSVPASSSRGLQPPPQQAGAPPRNVHGAPSQAPQPSTSTSSSRKVPPPQRPAVGLQRPSSSQSGVPPQTSGVQSFVMTSAPAPKSNRPGPSSLSNVQNADASNDQN